MQCHEMIKIKIRYISEITVGNYAIAIPPVCSLGTGKFFKVDGKA